MPHLAILTSKIKLNIFVIHKFMSCTSVHSSFYRTQTNIYFSSETDVYFLRKSKRTYSK